MSCRKSLTSLFPNFWFIVGKEYSFRPHFSTLTQSSEIVADCFTFSKLKIAHLVFLLDLV